MADKNLIPSINTGGSFEAIAPFNSVVIPSKFYTVEAIRTIQEMEALKLDLYALVFAPVGVSPEDFQTVLSRARSEQSVIVSLVDRDGIPVCVPTTYLKSFPLTDGHVYERMCLVVDLGSCSSAVKDEIAQAQQHIKEYIASTIGITKEVKLGTIPGRSYTSAQQHASFEATRKLAKEDLINDVTKNKDLQTQLIKRDAYIQKLEAELIALATPTPGP